jgi:hypothetical protein
MQRSKSKTPHDCQCHYTGFHPRFNAVPKAKKPPAQLDAQSPMPAQNQSKSKRKPKENG